MSWRRFCAVVLGALLVVSGLATPALAADPAQFRAGAIISNSVFYNSSTMDASAVQTFLDVKGRQCTAGVPSCLKDYRQSTVARPAEANVCDAYTARASESAAEIIVNVSRACGINPQVLLVLLEKEQSLITRTRPTARSYEIATGFGCPDGAPCVAEYYGFANQVYRAARQFKLYESRPTRYGFQAGRVNSIQWSPNAACGAGNVYIENQATAGLYNYTPYQPNQSALFGSGDSCSSWGNRNFWWLFTDWFGNPMLPSGLVRTEASPDVYLVTESARHYVGSLALLATYSRTGPVRIVNDADLASVPVGAPATPLFVDISSGAVYLADGSSRHHVVSCQQAIDFGASCGTLPRLSGAASASFRDAGLLSSTVAVAGTRFLVQGGEFREVFDEVALASAGGSSTVSAMSAGAIHHLSTGRPVLRDRVIIDQIGSERSWIWVDGRRHEIPRSAVGQQSTLASMPRRSMTASSIEMLPPGLHVTGVVGSSTSARRYLLGTDGLTPITPMSGISTSATTWSDGFIATFPQLPVRDTAYVRPASSSSVYRISGNSARQALTWTDFIDYAGGAPAITTMPDAVWSNLGGLGAPLLSPGSLVKAGSSPSIYVVTGPDTLSYVESFSITGQLGFAGITEVSASAITMAQQVQPLSTVVTCGPNATVGVSGVSRPVAGALDAATPRTTLSPGACARLTRVEAPVHAPVFLKTPTNRDVYLLENGQARHVLSMASLVNLAGTTSPTIALVPTSALSVVPHGLPIP